jgi:hypothetical protein
MPRSSQRQIPILEFLKVDGDFVSIDRRETAMFRMLGTFFTEELDKAEQQSAEDYDEIRGELVELREEVKDLRECIGVSRHRLTRGDRVYLKLRPRLEQEHKGKIAAIDLESEKVVGIGDSVLEAFEQAKKETGHDKFFFKRVGSDAIHSI